MGGAVLVGTGDSVGATLTVDATVTVNDGLICGVRVGEGAEVAVI